MSSRSDRPVPTRSERRRRAREKERTRGRVPPSVSRVEIGAFVVVPVLLVVVAETGALRGRPLALATLGVLVLLGAMAARIAARHLGSSVSFVARRDADGHLIGVGIVATGPSAYTAGFGGGSGGGAGGGGFHGGGGSFGGGGARGGW